MSRDFEQPLEWRCSSVVSARTKLAGVPQRTMSLEAIIWYTTSSFAFRHCIPTETGTPSSVNRKLHTTRVLSGFVATAISRPPQR